VVAPKPPPPPKRRAASGDGAAAESPKAEAKRPRVKPWWEELFTDDFGRGIPTLTDSQVKREVTYIEEALGVARGAVVLDLACGIGQQAVELASRGYGVVGYDLSLPQLAAAGELAQERGQKLNFLQGDMREMSFDEAFDGVYCWNTSFGYFEEEKNAIVAQNVFRALRPGGSFLLDVINRDFVVGDQPSSVWFEGDACVCMDDMVVDFITSRMKVKRTLMLDDGRSKECNDSIRLYSLHELGKLLHDIGFRVTEATGHPAYPGVFLGASSPRVIIVAQKP
jgi:SAM-dependent methyltransferase